MFLAIAFLFQSLRLLLPMIPGPVNMFLIGSLLNTVMVLSIWYTKNYWAAVIGGLLPLGAFFQGQLPIAWMVPVVAWGNMALIVWAGAFRHKRLLYLGPVVKMVLLYGGTQWVLQMMKIPEPMQVVMLFMMSWPQLVTAMIGIVLAKQILQKYPPVV
ncbi:hypothetical protein SAMN02910356_00756 [Selenomonas sp. GACV-9]|nr:hypothetical protein SAMN02910356_00756 [Selenomonas ruminantium]